MRLFTGIDLPEQVVEGLNLLLDKLKPTARVKWSPPDNLHITTKFIGEWPDARLDELKQALGGLPGHAPVRISVRGLGFFPNPHSPRVFWAGVEAGPTLAALAGETDGALARLGVEAEKGEYSPHLTLARIKQPVQLRDLREAIAGFESLEFGEFTGHEFHLYQSRLTPAGSLYTKLADFPLAKS